MVCPEEAFGERENKAEVEEKQEKMKPHNAVLLLFRKIYLRSVCTD